MLLLMIAFTSNLCMSLTHYAAGPSPVIFNAWLCSSKSLVETRFLRIRNQLNYLYGPWFRMDEIDWYVVRLDTQNFIYL